MLKYIIEILFDWFYRIITTKKKKTKTKTKNKDNGSEYVTYIYLSLSEQTKLIDDKREEEKVNVYEIKFQSTYMYRETNNKEIVLSLLFFILKLTAYKREEIT